MIRWHRAGWKLFRRLKSRPGRPRGDLHWSTFLHLHVRGIIACDFSGPVTATFPLMYVFLVIEHRSRRLVHYNVTTHPRVHSEILDSPLSCRASAHGAGSGCSRSAARLSQLPPAQFAPSPSRLPVRDCIFADHNGAAPPRHGAALCGDRWRRPEVGAFGERCRVDLAHERFMRNRQLRLGQAVRGQRAGAAVAPKTFN